MRRVIILFGIITGDRGTGPLSQEKSQMILRENYPSKNASQGNLTGWSLRR